jgi:hypothetical protein
VPRYAADIVRDWKTELVGLEGYRGVTHQTMLRDTEWLNQAQTCHMHLKIHIVLAFPGSLLIHCCNRL